VVPFVFVHCDLEMWHEPLREYTGTFSEDAIAKETFFVVFAIPWQIQKDR